MPPVSAGLMMFRLSNGYLEVFLGHPGGPFFQKKNLGVWGIPKGLLEAGEEPQFAAIREFQEETGIIVNSEVELFSLGKVILKSRKIIHAWAFEGDWTQKMGLKSNNFEMEWPPNSGVQRVFPEIDKADFFDLKAAEKRIHPGQLPFLSRLESLLVERS